MREDTLRRRRRGGGGLLFRARPARRFCFMDIYDVLGATGLILTAVGCWLIYPPLAFLVTGVALVGVAVVGAGRRGR
jgi:hypothetical protein